MDNQQIHAYHQQVLDDQDAQLDALGESIGRQRELSMRIGDELDEHIVMLDEMDGAVSRQQGRLDTAGRHLGRIARAAGSGNDSKGMAIIVALIVILVLLIAILK
jgi:syntaxin 8